MIPKPPQQWSQTRDNRYHKTMLEAVSDGGTDEVELIVVANLQLVKQRLLGRSMQFEYYIYNIGQTSTYKRIPNVMTCIQGS